MPLVFRRVLPQNTIPTILLPEIDDACSYNENKLLEQEGHKDSHLAAHLAIWLTCAKQVITHSCQKSSTAAAVNYAKNNKRVLLFWELRLVWHVCRKGLETDNDQKVYLYLCLSMMRRTRCYLPSFKAIIIISITQAEVWRQISVHWQEARKLLWVEFVILLSFWLHSFNQG